MYFTKVELCNFGIYKGTHEMDLTDQTGARNITLVGGLNGRGKTTFHNAILLALYGKQALSYIQEKARSYEKLLLDHINKHTTAEETYTAVSLCLDDGTRLRVKRSWSVKGRKIDQQISVEKNGAADKYLGENWSYYMEEILPFGIARFFFFNNEKITQLADDTSFEQMKSAIRSAIGVSAIEKAIGHTDEVIRRKKSALAAFEKSGAYVELQKVEAIIDGIDQELEDAARQACELEKGCAAAAAALEAAEQEFWASGGGLGRSRDAVEQERNRVSEDVKKIRDEMLQMLMDPAAPLFMCRDLVAQSYNRELTMGQSEAARNSAKLLSDLFAQITERLTESEMDEASVQIAREIVHDVLDRHIPKGEDQEYGKRTSAAGMLLYERLISIVFQSISPRIEDLVNRVNARESELKSLDAHLGAADENTSTKQLLEDLKTAEAEKARAGVEYQRQLENIDALKRQREQLVSKRIQLVKEIAAKENTNDDNARIVKYAAMSIEVLSEFKVRLQREKTARLSAAATACFNNLVEKDSLIREIKIDPETLDVTLLDRDGNELLKSQLSAGEQQMFAVAVVWALTLTSGYKAPVIIDTPVARLDSSHRANFVTKYLPAASSQVVLLSTDEEIYGRYLDLVRDNVVDSYMLFYREEEQGTSIIHGYFGEA